MRELKIQSMPATYDGYQKVRSEILASLGAIDGDIVTAIVRRGMRSAEYKRLDDRRTYLEAQLIALDEYYRGRFNA